MITVSTASELRAVLESPNPEVFSTPPGDMSVTGPLTVNAAESKTWIGHGTELWINAGGEEAGLRFDGGENGAYKRHLNVIGLDLRTNAEIGVLLVNSNHNLLDRVAMVGSQDGLILRNDGPDGWSELNVIRDCSVSEARRTALGFERGTGRPSFRATQVTGFSAHIHSDADPEVAHTLDIGAGTNVYESVIEGVAWTRGGRPYPNAPYHPDTVDYRLQNRSARVQGTIKGTSLTWKTENGAMYGVKIIGNGADDATSIDISCTWPHEVGLVVQDRDNSVGPFETPVRVTGKVEENHKVVIL